MLQFQDSTKEPSLDQWQSLDWTRSIAIRANAGSGKTSVLIQRIVQILHHHPEMTLDQIVAITFTRKAGAQLREKLHQALTACLKQTKSPVWQHRLDELPRCSIGTIDSLCHQLLRTAIEQGMIDDLDPAFGILEPLDRNELLELALQRTESSNNPQVQEAWANWLKTQGRRELNGVLLALIRSHFDPQRCADAIAQFSMLSREDFLSCIAIPSLAGPLKEIKNGRDGLLRQLQAALAEMLKSPKGLNAGEKVQEVITQLRSTLDSSATRDDLQLISALRSALFTKEGTPKKQGLSHRGTHYFPLLQEIQERWAPWMLDWKFDFDQPDGIELTRQLVVLYTEAHQHFFDLCREENRYDFDFLTERVDRLLENESHRKRLTKHYRFILVDEFQDTNELQWKIIARVIGEDPEKAVRSNKLMIVGDPQQSIYRFRGADPTVFHRIIVKIQEGNTAKVQEPTAYDQYRGANLSTDEQRTGLMRLKKNYRSHHPLPLGLIDVLSATPLGSNYQHLERGSDKPESHCEVIYILPEGAEDLADDEQAEDQIAAEPLDAKQLEMVANELQKLRGRGFNWKDMAILLRSRNALLVDLEKTLRVRRIPYQLVGGIGFWQRQEVRDLVCLANALANGADELALFAVLRGPLCGLDDSELLFLSMLGRRKLLPGLQRIRPLLDAEEVDWSDAKHDEQTRAALQKAFEAITTDRKQVLRNAANRLGNQGTWRERVDRLPHADLFRMALDESGAWGIYAEGDDGDRRLANIAQFFDEAHQLEAGRPTALADLARRLKTQVDESLKDEEAELTTANGDAVRVMTVHAAKGLEFKVVAVIGLEKKFNFRIDAVMLFDRHQHGRRDGDLAVLEKLHGLPAIAFRDPEQPLLKVNPLFHQILTKVERQLTIEEEARIFHVAITRAEQVLILAGAGQNPKQRMWPPENTWQKWVHDALRLDAGIVEGNWPVQETNSSLRIVRSSAPATPIDNGTQAIPPVDLEPMAESPRRRNIAATALTAMLEQFVDNRHEWEMEHRHRVRPRVEPIDRLFLEGGGGAKPGEKAGAHIGNLVHRALEMGPAFPKDAKQRVKLLRAQAAALLNRRSDPDEPGSSDENTGVSIDAIVAAAERILKEVIPNNPFLPLFKCEGYAEVDFRIVIANWIINGRFDRLIQREGSWEIVDWKTDAISVRAIEMKYGDQMKLYALALLRSAAEVRRPTKIVVHLAMTHHRTTTRLEFDTADLEKYGEELGQRLTAIGSASP